MMSPRPAQKSPPLLAVCSITMPLVGWLISWQAAQQVHDYQKSSSHGLVTWAYAAGGLLALSGCLGGIVLSDGAHCEPLHEVR